MHYNPQYIVRLSNGRALCVCDMFSEYSTGMQATCCIIFVTLEQTLILWWEGTRNIVFYIYSYPTCLLLSLMFGVP